MLTREHIYAVEKADLVHEPRRDAIAGLRRLEEFATGVSPAASPELLAYQVRKHWTVENNIHWLKDAVTKEDRTRQRNPNVAQALGLLRTASLAPVRKAGRQSLTHATEDFAANKWAAILNINHQHLA